MLLLGSFLLAFSSHAKTTENKSMSYFETPIAGAELVLSAEGTEANDKVKSAGMVPRGSAVLTPSGDLAKQGITHIIHVAPGAMTRSGPEFDPTLDGLKKSLDNTLLIADKKSLQCVALPFIGGGIFLHALKMTKEELARTIVTTVKDKKPKQRIIFVAYGSEDTQIFTKIMKAMDLPKNLELVSGSYEFHRESYKD